MTLTQLQKKQSNRANYLIKRYQQSYDIHVIQMLIKHMGESTALTLLEECSKPSEEKDAALQSKLLTLIKLEMRAKCVNGQHLYRHVHFKCASLSGSLSFLQAYTGHVAKYMKSLSHMEDILEEREDLHRTLMGSASTMMHPAYQLYLIDARADRDIIIENINKLFHVGYKGKRYEHVESKVLPEVRCFHRLSMVISCVVEECAGLDERNRLFLQAGQMITASLTRMVSLGSIMTGLHLYL